MNEALFHSFYGDDGLVALKHAALYFERLVLPDDAFFVAWGENSRHSRWIQLIPTEARPHVEFLSREGIVRLLSTNDGSAPTPQQLHELVTQEIAASGHRRVYEPSDAAPIFEFLHLRPDAPDAVELAGQISLVVSGFCLRASAGQAMPCVDNRIILDTMLFGIRGVFEQMRGGGALSAEEIAQAKSNFLASRLFSLQLPQVAFRNLEDVLEARYVLRAELASLRAAVTDSASHVASNPWEPDFTSRLEVHLHRRVLPEVAALATRARLSLPRAGMTLATAALSVGLQSLLPDRLARWLVGVSSVSLVQALRGQHERSEAELSRAPFGALLRIRNAL